MHPEGSGTTRCATGHTSENPICRALAAALRCVEAAAGGRPVELLRKESLAGLPQAAAARVLSHAYAAVVPITPLPYPPLPLAPGRPGATRGLRGCVSPALCGR